MDGTGSTVWISTATRVLYFTWGGTVTVTVTVMVTGSAGDPNIPFPGWGKRVQSGVRYLALGEECSIVGSTNWRRVYS